ncbi:MAG: DUF4410 domain-containing protein [Chthoniobacterales bacterium]
MLSSVALTACSSVSVIEERENAALAPKSAPAELFVRSFEVPVGTKFEVAAPRGEKDARSSAARTIIEGVCSRGSRWVAPTKAFEDPKKTPTKGLLIDGKILRAQQGSRALRIGIGFGAGRTRLDTAVRVFNLDASSKEPWLTFKTTGGSNMEPGLVTGLISPPSLALPIIATVAGTAVSTVTKGNKGVSQDAKRTGRAIVATIHDSLASKGLVKRKAWPKRIGTLGTPIGQLNVPSID